MMLYEPWMIILDIRYTLSWLSTLFLFFFVLVRWETCIHHGWCNGYFYMAPMLRNIDFHDVNEDFRLMKTSPQIWFWKFHNHNRYVSTKSDAWSTREMTQAIRNESVTNLNVIKYKRVLLTRASRRHCKRLWLQLHTWRKLFGGSLSAHHRPH